MNNNIITRLITGLRRYSNSNILWYKNGLLHSDRILYNETLFASNVDLYVLKETLDS